eukprot:226752-Amphidinium_carterae.1
MASGCCVGTSNLMSYDAAKPFDRANLFHMDGFCSLVLLSTMLDHAWMDDFHTVARFCRDIFALVTASFAGCSMWRVGGLLLGASSL